MAGDLHPRNAPENTEEEERVEEGDLWYRNAVIYSVDIESFFDSNGDGVGDFQGLKEKLDYISGLGVRCLWLQPFYPTPDRDDGYDVSDYYSVDPRLGTPGDFVAFIRAADERGIRVIVDLVANHTSDQHPWFQAARQDRRSRYRNYYVWADNPPLDERRGGVVFPGEQAGNWAYDSRAGAYYWHWFYSHQPDLNTGNPDVIREIQKIMDFWLQMGVSGFRMDAAPFLIRRKGLKDTYPRDPHLFLRELRDFLTSRRGDAVFLAEADVNADQLPDFFGDGDKMHLVFNFILNNYFFLALARQSSEPLARGLAHLPERPPVCQWANFVRNHDELNLDRLTPDERDEVFRAFAPDPVARIYGRGIRRRLPPMLGGDRRRLEMTYSLLFSLPGAPVLRYGDEIGMGDDLSLAGRMSVRTPMQWSHGRSGGFSTAPPERLVRPVAASGAFGSERVNVDVQRPDPTSFLSFMTRLIRTRGESPEIGMGEVKVLETGDASVFGHRARTSRGEVMALHNLAEREAAVTLDLTEADATGAVDLLGDRAYEPLRGGRSRLDLAPFGYRWIRIR